MNPGVNELEKNNKTIIFGVWALIVILIFIAYWPSLHGPLVFDDIQNIVQNPGVAIDDLSFASLEQTLLSNDSGKLKRILPALSFGINHYMAGGFTDTWAFKLTNLLIHIINSGLVMGLTLLLWPLLKFPGRFSTTQIILAAALVTCLWSLHPLQVSTVAYVVQRMTSMAATSVLLGLCLFVYGRKLLETQFSRGLTYMTIGVICGALLGLLSKENAVLISCYAAVIEWTLFKRSALETKQKRLLHIFYSVLVLIPVCLALVYFFLSPGKLITSYVNRPFSLPERLWTESRILWFYLSLIFVPDITSMGLFHDDIAVSRSWLQPISTLVAVIGWGVTLMAAFLLRHRLPIFTFAVLWFLAGHSLESSFIPLELVYEHRNYLPSLGIIIFIVYIVFECFNYLLNSIPKAFVRQYAAIFLGGLIIASITYTTWLRANYWANEKNIFSSIGLNHTESAISQYLYGEVLFKTENKPLQAYPHYFKAAELNPDEVAFLVMAVLTTPPEIMRNVQDPHLKKIFSNAHIVDLILHKPLSAWSLTIFDSAGSCVLSKHKHCLAHTPDVVTWLQAVLKSHYISKKYKRKYAQQLYNIQMLNGLYEGALQTTLVAMEKNGRAFQYFLMQAEVLQALGRYQQALSVLHEAEIGVRGRRPDLLQKVQQMQKIISQKI